ncbi:hypothetical protein HDC92_001016 [Pedobacter sp. AK017]|uniref:hypothetical protein n=1 Tax=Pedobacter sp. AK017 TaxID=2723073 RepID=UPI00160C5D13|nr:hypothetical protein [Pedobacter sp. AK017]MBB5437348.1 hypothetical protein [Pedobacter sp. AK017]
MNKTLQITIYLDGINVGNLVLKTTGQYYKITGLTGVLPLAGDLQQFMRAVDAGARPASLFTLCNLDGKGFEIAYGFADELVFLKLWLKTADAGMAMVFDWAGGFEDFKNGFKIM